MTESGSEGLKKEREKQNDKDTLTKLPRVQVNDRTIALLVLVDIFWLTFTNGGMYSFHLLREGCMVRNGSNHRDVF